MISYTHKLLLLNFFLLLINRNFEICCCQNFQEVGGVTPNDPFDSSMVISIHIDRKLPKKPIYKNGWLKKILNFIHIKILPETLPKSCNFNSTRKNIFAWPNCIRKWSWSHPLSPYHCNWIDMGSSSEIHSKWLILNIIHDALDVVIREN